MKFLKMKFNNVYVFEKQDLQNFVVNKNNLQGVNKIVSHIDDTNIVDILFLDEKGFVMPQSNFYLPEILAIVREKVEEMRSKKGAFH